MNTKTKFKTVELLYGEAKKLLSNYLNSEHYRIHQFNKNQNGFEKLLRAFNQYNIPAKKKDDKSLILKLPNKIIKESYLFGDWGMYGFCIFCDSFEKNSLRHADLRYEQDFLPGELPEFPHNREIICNSCFIPIKAEWDSLLVQRRKIWVEKKHSDWIKKNDHYFDPKSGHHYPI